MMLQRVPLVEQELNTPTLPEHPITPQLLVRFVFLYLLFCCARFCRLLFVFCLLAIVLSLFLRYTDFDYLPLYLQNLLASVQNEIAVALHT